MVGFDNWHSTRPSNCRPIVTWERNVLPHSEAEKYKDVCDIIDEFLEKESVNGWLFGCWRFVAFIIMKWIESVTNIALCQQVALDSVLETSYEQDTVKEFTRLEDLKNNSYHMNWTEDSNLIDSCEGWGEKRKEIVEVKRDISKMKIWGWGLDSLRHCGKAQSYHMMDHNNHFHYWNDEFNIATYFKK